MSEDQARALASLAFSETMTELRKHGPPEREVNVCWGPLPDVSPCLTSSPVPCMTSCGIE